MSLRRVHQGKVRDLYDLGEGRLLMVASDRLSAFDVVMAEPVPGKGRVLTAMSAFWFEHLRDVAPNHLLSTSLEALDPADRRDELAGRIMVVRRCEMLPIECIVRGHLAGSAWKEYAEAGTVHGIALPAGLRQADPLPEPIFTPSTKAPSDDHDENITFDRAVDLVGPQLAEEARALSLAVYRAASDHAAARGIVVADTKLELGLLDGELVLADEVLTPDSSRFWPAGGYEPGTSPPGYDKQPVRDWLEATGWNKRPPPPPLPAAVIEATRARYVEIYERLSDRDFAAWRGSDTPPGGRGGGGGASW